MFDVPKEFKVQCQHRESLGKSNLWHLELWNVDRKLPVRLLNAKGFDAMIDAEHYSSGVENSRVQYTRQ